MVLENRRNITDSTELVRTEEKISKKKAVELFENGYLNENPLVQADLLDEQKQLAMIDLQLSME